MSFTPQQRRAIESPGNTLVVAGAGAGKTGTLVERCLRLLLDPAAPVDISRVLVVTFTEAAAAEVRERIRQALDRASLENPRDLWIQKQIAGLDSAHISTLHSFCLTLLREHFYDLDLDPSLSVLPDEQAQMLFLSTFEELLTEHYLGGFDFSADLKEVLRIHFGGWDKRLFSFTRRLHHFTQTRPDPHGWFEHQFRRLAAPDCAEWRDWFAAALQDWCAWWHPCLAGLPADNTNAHHCAKLLQDLSRTADPTLLAALLDRRESWPARKKIKHSAPFGKFFDEADFLDSLSAPGALQEDWNWFRGPLQIFLRFVRQFSERFAAAKRERGAVDFHDLEQFALRLLWDPATQSPTPIAESWRKRLLAVFVDEYQDINSAQDLIISALSQEQPPGNRFLVGDIKQSIYRFRQADPGIFRRYLNLPHGWDSAVLAENFRSHEGILDFINPLFAWLMQGTLGETVYDGEARLRFGAREERAAMAASPGEPLPVELHLLLSDAVPDENEENDQPELENAEEEARIVAARLSALRASKSLIYHRKEKQSRPVDWKDMVVLLRAASGKLEIYAKAFEAMGVPLQTRRTGFFSTPEVLDLINVLTILDNPLQDIPLVAVLRSPLVAMTADELALVRIHFRNGPFWTALHHFLEIKKDSTARQKLEQFLSCFHRWRDPRASASLAQRLDAILSDTGYAEWLLTQPRGRQRHANVQQLLRVARNFDEVRGESLYLFLRHLEQLQDAAGDIEPAPASDENAVRLMTIHQSKGLEFPVVAVADLGKRFNTGDQNNSILLHEKYGLCSAIQPPDHPTPYPSLPLWLAAREERIELVSEEMRIFYVALTRAENRLLLFGTTSQKRIDQHWSQNANPRPFPQQLLRLNSALDWLGAFGTLQWPGSFPQKPDRLPFPVQLHLQPPSPPQAALPPQPQWTADQLAVFRQHASFAYPHLTATSQAAKTTVSLLRRRAAEQDEEAAELSAKANSERRVSFTRHTSPDGTSRQRGLATHTFLQHHHPSGNLDAPSLRAQADSLVARQILSPAHAALIDFDALASFWSSAFGLAVRERLSELPAELHRELPFTARLTRADLARISLESALPVPPEEFVVIQGIADFVVLRRDEIWLIDFKTDQLMLPELDARVADYRPQLALYSLALEQIYRRPVTRAGFYFLALKRFEWL